jgi:hypothetical protein
MRELFSLIAQLAGDPDKAWQTGRSWPTMNSRIWERSRPRWLRDSAIAFSRLNSAIAKQVIAGQGI